MGEMESEANGSFEAAEMAEAYEALKRQNSRLRIRLAVAEGRIKVLEHVKDDQAQTINILIDERPDVIDPLTQRKSVNNNPSAD